MIAYQVSNPATGEVLDAHATLTYEELESALTLADRAHSTWSRRTTVAQRASLLIRVADLHRERRDLLADIVVKEMGKPREQALIEVDFCVEIYVYYAENAVEFLSDEPITLRGGQGSAFIRRTSLGLLLGIMPWNFPLYQVARFAGPNLAAGNTILLKHAPQCPESALALEQIFVDAGFPQGAYQNVFASHGQVEQVIADSRLQGVSLTGSERAGSAVAEIAGRHLKKIVLELGGSDPFVVLSTDDLDATVDLAVQARLDNNGQSCNAAKRFIIVADLYDDFVQRFATALTAYAPEDPSRASSVLGPLSSVVAAEHLSGQVAAALEGGARIVAGEERHGTYFSPILLADVAVDNPAYREEFFGPVAVVHRAADEADAVTLANDTPFGLGSYVFTTNEEQALRVADQLEAGMVFINTVLADSAELSFGGVKRSGFGRELGRLGAEEFVNKKLIRIA